MNLHREGGKMLTWRRDEDGAWLVEVAGLDIVGYGRKREVAAYMLSLAAKEFALAVLNAPDLYSKLVPGAKELSLLEKISGCPNLVEVRRLLRLPSLRMLGQVRLEFRRIGGSGRKKTRSCTGRVENMLARMERFARRVARQLVAQRGFTAAQASYAVLSAGFQRHLTCDVEYAICREVNYWAARLAKSHKTLEHTRTTPG